MTTSITAFPITAKQIAELTSASSAAGTDYLMAQQGATGTAYRKMTVAQVMGSGAAVVASGVTVNAATIPANGLYLPVANTLGWAVNSAAEMRLTSSALSPAVSDGNALGTSSLMWADLFLASGGVVNWNNGTYTLTQSSAVLIANGQFLVNMNAATAPANLSGTMLRAAGADSSSHYFLGDTFGGAMYYAARRSGGTNATPTALASGNIIGGIIARGHDGSAYSGQRASVVMLAEEAWTGSAHGSGVLISSTLNGTTTEVDRLLIDGTGAFTFGPSGNTWKLTPSTTGGTAIAIAGGSTGGMTLATSGGVQFAVGHTASAVNYVSAKGGATGTGATISALGSDANIDLIVTPKGSGQFNISGTAATTAGTPASFSANRYIAIKINGTSYYLPIATATW